MNKKERQGIADAFRACLHYLWDGKGSLPRAQSVFICDALSMAGKGWAREIVMGRLCGFPALGAWLLHQIGEERYQAEVTNQRLQAHRKAWVLQLIEEFEQ